MFLAFELTLNDSTISSEQEPWEDPWEEFIQSEYRFQLRRSVMDYDNPPWTRLEDEIIRTFHAFGSTMSLEEFVRAHFVRRSESDVQSRLAMLSASGSLGSSQTIYSRPPSNIAPNVYVASNTLNGYSFQKTKPTLKSKAETARSIEVTDPAAPINLFQNLHSLSDQEPELDGTSRLRSTSGQNPANSKTQSMGHLEGTTCMSLRSGEEHLIEAQVHFDDSRAPPHNNSIPSQATRPPQGQWVFGSAISNPYRTDLHQPSYSTRPDYLQMHGVIQQSLIHSNYLASSQHQTSTINQDMYQMHHPSTHNSHPEQDQTAYVTPPISSQHTPTMYDPGAIQPPHHDKSAGYLQAQESNDGAQDEPQEEGY